MKRGKPAIHLLIIAAVIGSVSNAQLLQPVRNEFTRLKNLTDYLQVGKPLASCPISAAALGLIPKYAACSAMRFA
jgi:hypothetical protein